MLRHCAARAIATASTPQCAKDAYCQAGKCTPKGKPADVCTTDKQCGSGHCADGVCCDTACTGQCEACNKVPGADAGTCSPVTGAPLGKRTACAANDPACGGSCDGKNRLTCNYPAQGQVCRDGACTDGKAIVTSYCDGHGACPAEQDISCAKGCEGPVCSGDECCARQRLQRSAKILRRRRVHAQGRAGRCLLVCFSLPVRLLYRRRVCAAASACLGQCEA